MKLIASPYLTLSDMYKSCDNEYEIENSNMSVIALAAYVDGSETIEFNETTE